jgi:tellurite resistance protein TehA-like permease
VSVTGANLLGQNAHLAIGTRYATALQVFGVIYGVPVLGFALLWVALAGAITLRAIADHLPFSLTWWSFTFPVGTCVTGTTALAAHTGADMFRNLATVLYICLVLAWLVVVGRTAHDTVRGRIFLPPPIEPTPALA